MLTPHDDFIGHQLPTTFHHVVSSDDRWTERYWYSGLPIGDGDVILDMGLGYYPNRNVMDAFAGITVDNVQHTYRSSRRLGRNPLETRVGAIRFEILEGMKRHRAVLQENSSGLSFDLEFQARFPASLEAHNFRRKRGRVEDDLCRMSQFGRWEGWLEHQGKRYEVTPDLWWGQRDHSWGVRSRLQTDMTGNQSVPDHRDFLWFWVTYQFEDFAIAIFLKETAPGKPFFFSGSEVRSDGSERHLLGVEHEIEWADDPRGQTWTGGSLKLAYEDGGSKELKLTTLPGRFFLKGGGYGGHEGWNHGDDMGQDYATHYRWNLADLETRRLARTLGDHVTRVECDGWVGYGVSEYGVARGYPRYENAQRHPAL